MTSEPSPDLDPAIAVSVGRIMGAHGIHGELLVEPLTDFPERFQRGGRLWLAGQPRQIERVRWQDDNVLLKLSGIDDRVAAQALRGQALLAPQPHALSEGRYYLHDMIGLTVEDADGAPLGRLVEVLATGANDVYVVHGERGELLLPAIEDVVRQVDLDGRRLVVELLPGLEFRPSQAPRRLAGGGAEAKG